MGGTPPSGSPRPAGRRGLSTVRTALDPLPVGVTVSAGGCYGFCRWVLRFLPVGVTLGSISANVSGAFLRLRRTTYDSRLVRVDLSVCTGTYSACGRVGDPAPWGRVAARGESGIRRRKRRLFVVPAPGRCRLRAGKAPGSVPRRRFGFGGAYREYAASCARTSSPCCRACSPRAGDGTAGASGGGSVSTVRSARSTVSWRGRSRRSPSWT